MGKTKGSFPHDFQDGRGEVEVRRHENGGGLVEVSAWADPTVYVASEASIREGGVVRDDASIDDCAVVSGGVVSGRARIKDRATVSGGNISGEALISGKSRIEGDPEIAGRAEVSGSAIVRGSAQIINRAVISGGIVEGRARIGGTVVMRSGRVAGRAMIGGNVTISGSGVRIGGDAFIEGNEEGLAIRGGAGGPVINGETQLRNVSGIIKGESSGSPWLVDAVFSGEEVSFSGDMKIGILGREPKEAEAS